MQTVAGVVNNPMFTIQDSIYRIELPTRDGTRIVSLGAGTVAMTELRPYDGWEAFRPRIASVLNAYSETTDLNIVFRIGLRYINRIVVQGTDVRPEIYLTRLEPSDPVLGTLQNGFMYRDEYARDHGCRIIVTRATLQPAGPSTTEYLVDVDTVWNAGTIGTHDEIMEKVDHLHDIEGAAFESLITDDARRLFDAD